MRLNREKIISFLLLFISAAVFAGATYLILDSKYISEWMGHEDSNTKVVAHITRLQNDVRKKGANHFTWQSTNESAEVKNFDSIFTGDDSTTEVQFLDKSSIELNSKTLVTIRLEENKIYLKKGSIKVNLLAGSSKRLVVNNKPIDVTAQKSAVIEVAVDDINVEPEIKIVTGDVIIKKLQLQKKDEPTELQVDDQIADINLDKDQGLGSDKTQEPTLEKVYNPIKRKEFSKIEPLELPVVIPDIPVVEKELKTIEPKREIANLIEEPPKIYGLDLDIGFYGGLGSMSNSTSSSSPSFIYPRSMVVGAVFLELGWQIKNFTPFVYGEYRLVGQLTSAADAGNQNMAGGGYLVGAGLKYDFEKFFLSAGYEFLGSYKLNKQTTLGENSIYSNPSGYIATLGYKTGKKLRLTYTFNLLTYASWNLSSTTTNTEEYKLNQTTHGLGIQYELF